MKSITIGKNDSNQRLDKFLLKSFGNLPKSLMYKEIRKKNIKVNKKRAQNNQMLQIGDVVDVYIKDELLEAKPKHYDFLTSSKDLDIIYEDENMLVLNKKVGILSHPDKNEYKDTLISRVQRYMFEKKEWSPENEANFTPALANRIDRNTGGIVIAAKNAETLRALNLAIKNRDIKKYYLAIVHGKMSRKTETIHAYLAKDENRNKVSVKTYEFPNSKPITTKYKVLDYYPDLSLVEVDLITGRTHQIRAHLASIGHPLLNDGKYGVEVGRFRQALYSYKIEFNIPENSSINYLNKKVFEVTDIDFLKDFKERKL